MDSLEAAEGHRLVQQEPGWVSWDFLIQVNSLLGKIEKFCSTTYAAYETTDIRGTG